MDEQTVVTTTPTQMLAIRKARADLIDAGVLITTFVGASHAMTIKENPKDGLSHDDMLRVMAGLVAMNMEEAGNIVATINEAMIGALVSLRVITQQEANNL